MCTKRTERVMAEVDACPDGGLPPRRESERHVDEQPSWTARQRVMAVVVKRSSAPVDFSSSGTAGTAARAGAGG
jgi:hypothetical protein